MTLTITLKPGSVSINGIAIEDSTAAKVIRYSEPVEYLPDGIVVKVQAWTLPVDVQRGIWPVLVPAATAFVNRINEKERQSQEWWARRARRNNRMIWFAAVVWIIGFALFLFLYLANFK